MYEKGFEKNGKTLVCNSNDLRMPWVWVGHCRVRGIVIAVLVRSCGTPTAISLCHVMPTEDPGSSPG